MSTSVGLSPLDLPACPPRRLPIHLAYLVNYIRPDTLPIYRELAKRVEKLSILLSAPMDTEGRWQQDWGGLDVALQRTWTIRRPRRHALGFNDHTLIHIPVDTLGRLRRLQPDAVLTCELGFRTLFSEIYARWLRRTPLIIQTGLSEHTERGQGWLRRAARKILLKRGDAFVANGRSGARYLQQMGAPADRIYRVHYPALPGKFDGCPTDRPVESAHRLMFAGRLIELKGIVPFLGSLARWAAEDSGRRVEFWVAGSGPEREKIESVPLPAGVSLRLFGECSYDRLAELYSQAGIFVLPSLSDDWGMVVNEAMAAGLPVLGSVYSQAVTELCRDGETGWTFRTDVPADMDAALGAALSTPPDRLAEMRQAARREVQMLTPGHAADELITAVEAAVNRRAGKGEAPRDRGGPS